MSVWIIQAIVIEAATLIGVLGVLVSKSTRPAFLSGFNVMLPVTAVFFCHSPPFDARKIAIVVMVVIYLIRINWLLLVWRKDTAVSKLDTKQSAAEKFILPVILTNVAGWGYCLPFYFAAKMTSPLDALDFIAFGVYLVASVIHFASDYQKRQFKARPESKGRILDTGLWSICRHPNYFGDFLIYVSFGLIGHCVWGWICPLLNFLQYWFDAIPKSEKWAAEKYGASWREYSSRTKSLIPFIL